jgi:hypothetical protein
VFGVSPDCAQVVVSGGKSPDRFAAPDMTRRPVSLAALSIQDHSREVGPVAAPEKAVGAGGAVRSEVRAAVFASAENNPAELSETTAK